ncbi:hypothetical protein B8W72_20785 [Pseudomonas putida]|uniref:Uncharacterized protein n=1 Tax=Pseudomonas putida TaxID=303 RepID=A0A1Y3KQY9_PSEPU|nr:hypothetical protein [Pseudomonas putida]OUM28296.1 hypothetical protein B8W72_20785 [Pseudomonas putida]
MNSTQKRSAAFITSLSRHMRRPVLDEAAYDRALLDVANLEHRRQVSHLEWVEMVRAANRALIQWSV